MKAQNNVLLPNAVGKQKIGYTEGGSVAAI